MRQIFINLPVENTEKSKEFYAQLGFSINPLFSDDHQKCMVWNEHIYVMLISREKFKFYSKKNISNRSHINAYFTLPVESLDKMNETVDNGLKAGGKETNPMIDEAFMQIRAIEDFDGHLWHIIFMDLTKFRKERN